MKKIAFIVLIATAANFTITTAQEFSPDAALMRNLKTPRPPTTPNPNLSTQQKLQQKLAKAKQKLKETYARLHAKGQEALRQTIRSLDRQITVLDDELKKMWFFSEPTKVINEAIRDVVKKVDAVTEEARFIEGSPENPSPSAKIE